MTEQVAQAEQFASPERQMMILGPRIQPLSERVGTDQFAAPVTYRDQFGDSQYGETHTVSEAEMLTNYFDYLNALKTVSSEDEGEEGQAMKALADRFANETIFMSVEDRHQAIKGLTESQLDYLDADPGRALVYYIAGFRYATDKSEGLVLRETMEYAQQARPDLADRIKVIGLDDEDKEGVIQALPEGKTKLVVLDDWSVSGSQLSYTLQHARQFTARHGRPDLANATEINLLLIRGDQIQSGFADTRIAHSESDDGVTKPAPVRAYYVSPAIQSIFEGPVPTGAHSTVDYGFSEQLLRTRRYLEGRTGQETMMPQLASIKKLV